MNIIEFTNTVIDLVASRLMFLSGGVKFGIHFVTTASQPNHRPTIHANGKKMTFGEDYYWYTNRKGRLFVLAKW